MSAARPGMFTKLLPPILLVVGLGAFAFYLWSGLSRPASGPPGVTALDISFAVAFGTFLPMGVFIALRRPRNPVGWIMALIGLSNLVSEAATEYATRALLVEPGGLPGGPVAAFASGLVGVFGIGLIAFLMLLFPTGKLPSPRWRWVARAAAANLVLLLVGNLSLWNLRGRALLLDEPPEQDLLIPYVVFEITWIVMMVSAIAGLISLVVRYRRSSGVEKQQLKLMAYVAAVLGGLVFLNFIVLEALGVGSAGFRVATEYVLNLAVAAIPLAAAIAILRYRLFDIDVIVNRTLVYGALTAILAGAYVALVFAFQAVLQPFTAESDLAIAASTLAVAALFRPLRDRVQRFIDRRFYRHRFDAQRTLESFSAYVRDEVDLAALSARLVGVVEDTMRPSQISLWLRAADEPTGEAG